MILQTAVDNAPAHSWNLALVKLLLVMMLICPARGQAQSQVSSVRETWDGFGRLVRSLHLSGEQVKREITYQYDARNRLIRTTTREQGHETVEERIYGASGLNQIRTSEDGTLRTSITRGYEQGQLKTITVALPDGSSRITSFTYDLYGNVIKKEERDGSGMLLSEVIADVPRPIVPIHFSLNLGGSYQTDVNAVDLSGGFAIKREPPIEKFGADPLEVSVTGNYRYGRSGETITNNLLTASFNVDYHYLLPNTTFFLFTNLERNPSANLNVDLQVAPIGAKYAFFRSTRFRSDVSFAPIWNFRSVMTETTTTDENGDSATVIEEGSTSTFRGSLRVRGLLQLPKATIAEVLEYQPNMLPTDGSFQAALEQEAIIRNSLKFSFKISENMSINQEFRYVRDPSLVAQASYDEAGNCTSSLCEGYTFSSLSSLSLSLDVLR